MLAYILKLDHTSIDFLNNPLREQSRKLELQDLTHPYLRCGPSASISVEGTGVGVYTSDAKI